MVEWLMLDDSSNWIPLSPADSAELERLCAAGVERANNVKLGPKRWDYAVDFKAMVQSNTRTGKTRPLQRRAKGEGSVAVASASSRVVATGGAVAAARAAPFNEILAALRPFHGQLGRTPHFGYSDPHIPKKLTRSQLQESSDYEYIFLTVLGFQALAIHGEEIRRLNNFAHFKDNPGTRRLEEVCGLTMHAERPGSNGLLATAPDALLKAFDCARRKGIVNEFFMGKGAFDRTADPCLEGRLGRILEFIERHGSAEDVGPPPADVAVELMRPGSSAASVIGEHLRVFRNLCIWKWAQQVGLDYPKAKDIWMRTENGGATNAPASQAEPLPDVGELCNAGTFMMHLHSKGVIAGSKPPDGEPPPPFVLTREEVDRAVSQLVRLETLLPDSPYT